MNSQPIFQKHLSKHRMYPLQKQNGFAIDMETRNDKRNCSIHPKDGSTCNDVTRNLFPNRKTLLKILTTFQK